MASIMAKVGDLVEVIGIGRGRILSIRFDDRNEELYSIVMNDPEITPDGMILARHCELKWIR